MKKKKVHHEEHVDESWLIPYADMLTLLLALFIVMFAMSQVDKEKLQKTSEQFSVIFSSGSGMLQSSGNATIATEQAGTSDSNNTATEEQNMTETKEKIEEEIGKQGYSDKVKVDLNEGGLEVSIQDVILFNSGDSDVLKEVSPLLLKISSMLVNLDNDIKIVGHTDNMPINNEKFRSNWDLSAIRAINVMNFMVGSGGIKQEKVSIQAYGDQKPKFNNSTEDGRAKNRRVEIFVGRKYPAKTEATKK
ncbi:flagellar motor protein MotB [Clostridium uliginosum]|uniref:Chemotaxis protein MotB n=1 Tax=Clostridium uliginosum TaxID=119641 RepID=A0A1I1RJ12_9CLOT|nr:flagellar motor protein MotB [Clostridium uliginosum]SFD34311.1 chemotaxis protein MotB [Clostridium uliginosum]